MYVNAHYRVSPYNAPLHTSVSFHRRRNIRYRYSQLATAGMQSTVTPTHAVSYSTACTVR
jgi:hypothetical protein